MYIQICKDDNVVASELPAGAQPVPGYPNLYASPRGSVYSYEPTEGYFLLPVCMDSETGFLAVWTDFGWRYAHRIVQTAFGIVPKEGYACLPNDGEPWNLDVDNWTPVKQQSPFFFRLAQGLPAKLASIRETYTPLETRGQCMV